jgi:hypothetical protein
VALVRFAARPPLPDPIPSASYIHSFGTIGSPASSPSVSLRRLCPPCLHQPQLHVARTASSCSTGEYSIAEDTVPRPRANLYCCYLTLTPSVCFEAVNVNDDRSEQDGLFVCAVSRKSSAARQTRLSRIQDRDFNDRNTARANHQAACLHLVSPESTITYTRP